MAKVTITLPYPNKPGLYGMNSYYAGKHWSVRKKHADYWHDLVLYETPWNRPPLKSPVKITFFWNDRLDLSNHAMMAKYIEDSIKGRIIKDDSRNHVQEITHKFHDEKTIKVVIEEI